MHCFMPLLSFREEDEMIILKAEGERYWPKKPRSMHYNRRYNTHWYF